MKLVTKHTICVVLFLSFVSGLNAQNKRQIKILKGIQWNEGNVVLSDGSMMLGLVSYNIKTGLLSFKKGEESNSFTARSVSGFEFWDETIGKQRIFYSFLYTHNKKDTKQPFFFEILDQFKNFALVSKTDPIDIEQNSSPPSMGPNGATTQGISYAQLTQVETILFADDNGNMSPFLKITYDEDRQMKGKGKMVNESLFIKYTGQYYQRLYEFADHNKLKFTKKDDLLLILEHYRMLLEAEQDSN